jgi:choline-sulfatase
MQTDPHELTNLAALPAHRQRVADFQRRLADICDPDATDAAAKADQARCIQANGGEAAILAAGQQINFTRAPEQFRIG